MRRAGELERRADLRIVVLDASVDSCPEDEDVLARTARSARLVVRNKSDLVAAGRNGDTAVATIPDALAVSARTGDGVAGLREEIGRRLVGSRGLMPSRSRASKTISALALQIPMANMPSRLSSMASPGLPRMHDRFSPVNES